VTSTGQEACMTSIQPRLPQEGTTTQEGCQESYDLIVIGSGAGGLATAVTAAHLGMKVLVLEKAPVIGGTSAWSGGWMWLPRNPLAVAAGIVEDVVEPRRYLASLFGQPVNDARIDMFLEKGPEMVAFFLNHTSVRFIDGNKVPDFHDIDGARAGGRSLCAAPFDGRELGPWIHKLRPPLSVISLMGMGIAAGQDVKHFFNATRSLSSFIYAGKRIGKHLLDLARYGRGMQLVNGNALIAGLLKSALDKGVVLKTDANVLTLETSAAGRIQGVTVSVDGYTRVLNARKGVVMATGGFPHDKQRQQALFGEQRGTLHYSAAPKTNTGDGMRMAEQVGASIPADLSQPGAWSPVSLVPDGRGDYIHFPHLIERAKPGVIAVLPDGRRFTNEADSYHDFMQALFEATPKGQEPCCWLIADHSAQRRWGLGWSRPFPFPLSWYQRSGYLKSASSLQELAAQCGIDAANLKDSIGRFNDLADKGIDTDFGRGDSLYNRVQGNPDHRPNPSLAALRKAPFHAVKVVAGSLGTFTGIRTDEFCRVLDDQHQPIPGLFAAGNDLSSIFNGFYPSGGITLGPAMTFGYVLAQHLAAVPESAHASATPVQPQEITQ
jgi:succinate dehydrogenase/fumarate reductase flavoprotein subunit